MLAKITCSTQGPISEALHTYSYIFHAVHGSNAQTYHGNFFLCPAIGGEGHSSQPVVTASTFLTSLVRHTLYPTTRRLQEIGARSEKRKEIQIQALDPLQRRGCEFRSAERVTGLGEIKSMKLHLSILACRKLAELSFGPLRLAREEQPLNCRW
jgi:hypothetical protein